MNTVVHANSPIDHYHLIKYEADMLYSQKEFSKALIKYKERYSHLTPKNHALIRENCESIIRCCLELNLLVEAVHWTSIMVSFILSKF